MLNPCRGSEMKRYIKLRLIHAGLIVLMAGLYVFWLAHKHPIDTAVYLILIIIAGVYLV